MKPFVHPSRLMFKYGKGVTVLNEIAAEGLQTSDIDILFDQIMTDYGQDILQLTYSYVVNSALAEDLTQEIFVKCYHSLPKFEGRSSVKTWIWRIAINHCKDYLKSWQHRKVLLAYEKVPEPVSSYDTVERAVIRSEEDKNLIKAVLELPVKYREPIYLHYFEELSIKEIAMLTGIKNNTVKTRIRRAMAMLKDSLGGS